MKIGVIGAGVIGVSAALALAARGHRVTVFDREGVAAGASAGNAGAFAFAEIVPLATPGVMRKAPRWLFDPDGPLSIPPAYALRIAPWLVSFWRASLPGRYRAAVAAQSALMAHSAAALERLVARHGLSGMLRREGQLQLYEGEGEFRRSQREWEERRRAGIEFRLLESRDAIAEIQPGVARRFSHGGFTPGWINVTDPRLWVERLAEILTRAGGTIERADIRAIAASPSEARVTGREGDWRFD
ncbi:MAG: FAD-dependent oxidoreductase, partial [Sphingomonadaceae bacterium]|nr:FAD-dependent oxidoreductase [Sphingomonadaceae bacterium]